MVALWLVHSTLQVGIWPVGTHGWICARFPAWGIDQVLSPGGGPLRFSHKTCSLLSFQSHYSELFALFLDVIYLGSRHTRSQGMMLSGSGDVCLFLHCFVFWFLTLQLLYLDKGPPHLLQSVFIQIASKYFILDFVSSSLTDVSMSIRELQYKVEWQRVIIITKTQFYSDKN